MTPQEICQRLTDAGLQVTFQETPPEPCLEITSESLQEAAQLLKSNADLAFDSLLCLSALERPEFLETVYHLFSFKHRHHITLKVRCPKDDAVIPTVSEIWPTANWHEREAYDLIGIRYDGHPDLRRILLSEDWEGHPLRKDYQPPAFYHGIPLTTQLLTPGDEGN
ncbi:MAG: NADH-quinone oxidoreductase subunit C [bacterium]|nr:NADH-quinone oxidoreductase subunit C [bacterium]